MNQNQLIVIFSFKTRINKYKFLFSVVDPNVAIVENVRRIRDSLLYPYEQFPSSIGDGVPLVQWNLRFPFPFYGFLFNYTWVSNNLK